MMKKHIRILHVVDNLGKGGLENGLVNVIANLDRSRFEHVVLALRALGPNAERLTGDNVRLIYDGEQPGRLRTQVPIVARHIRAIRPEIVHSRNWGTIEAVFAARLTGGTVSIHSEHGLDAHADAKEPRRRRWIRRVAFGTAQRVFCVSSQLRDIHATRTGFPADRIGVIHNGVDSRKFRPDADARARARRALGIAGNELCIGCVGNLAPVKDYPTLLRAAKLLSRRFTGWRLAIVGSGPQRAHLEELARSGGECGRNISFLGLRHDVTDLLNAMDVYVLPSLIEGISNSLLEAMATGLPVIATRTGGNPEVVIDGDSGLLFPVGDAAKLADLLEAVAHSSELRADFGRAAMRRVQDEFSMEAMIANYDRLYSGAVARNRAPLATAAVA